MYIVNVDAHTRKLTNLSILPNMQVEHTRLKATRLLHSEIFAPSYFTATCTFTFQARTQQFLMIPSYAHYYQLLSWETSDSMIDFTEYPANQEENNHQLPNDNYDSYYTRIHELQTRYQTGPKLLLCSVENGHKNSRSNPFRFSLLSVRFRICGVPFPYLRKWERGFSICFRGIPFFIPF
jgi:hypothetical protein